MAGGNNEKEAMGHFGECFKKARGSR